MTNLEILALIPARGGSKSVPRKNIIEILGKPLISYTILTALESSLITRVVVSTDDEEIAEIAKAYGAEVPFLRPKKFAGDKSLDIDYHFHALSWLQNEEYVPDMIVNLRPTSPKRKSTTIDKAIRVFSNHPEADSLRSVRLASETPFKMWLFDEQGYMVPAMSLTSIKEPYNLPRQSLPLVYWQDGYVDITRPETVFRKRSTTGDLILPFIITEDSVDIDYLDTIPIAEKQLESSKSEDSITKENILPVTRHPS